MNRLMKMGYGIHIPLKPNPKFIDGNQLFVNC